MCVSVRACLYIRDSMTMTVTIEWVDVYYIPRLAVVRLGETVCGVPAKNNTSERRPFAIVDRDRFFTGKVDANVKRIHYNNKTKITCAETSRRRYDIMLEVFRHCISC